MPRWSFSLLALFSALVLFLAGCGGEVSTGSVVSATQDNFRSVVVASKRPVLVEFWSESCKPCKMLEPHLVSIAQEHQELLVVKVNSDENPDLRDDLGVQLLPTLFIYQDGEQKRRKIGFNKPEELDELISAYITSK